MWDALRVVPGDGWGGKARKRNCRFNRSRSCIRGQVVSAPSQGAEHRDVDRAFNLDHVIS
jgi:hypothetical protein